MKPYLLLAALILISKYDEVFSDDNDSVEKFEEKTLTSELVNILNGTFYNLNEKVCQLQRKVYEIADPDNRCECNETEIIGFKRSISNELKYFSKALSGFENQIRILKNGQAELRDRLGGGDSNAASTTTTTSTTTAAPRVCDQGWITSPEKCYYLSTSSEKTSWSNAITRCTSIGAKLIEIQTDEEAMFLLQSMPSHVGGDSDYIYTGRKLNDADDWVFVSNDKMVDTSVRSWSYGEPGDGTQRCGCMKQTNDFLMMDCLCIGFDLFYICEIAR